MFVPFFRFDFRQGHDALADFINVVNNDFAVGEKMGENVTINREMYNYFEK